MTASPLYIRVHPDDNVAIVVNDGGLPEGATFADGLTLREGVPQGHKVALVDLAAGDPIVRYNVVIGYALVELRRGSWVNERTMRMPEPPGLDDLPLATRAAPPLPPLEGYTFEGFRNADGSVGTRNILAITTTVQCVSGVVEHAVKRIKAELLPRYPNVDDVVGLRAHVRLRRGDRRARCRHPDPHAAQHQPESELRRRGDDREPRLREAAARAPAAARHDSGRGRRCDRQRRRGVPAGRRARRLQLDDRLDHDDGRIASRAAQPPPPRDVPGIGSRRRRAVRRQRCVLGATANPAVGFAADLLVRAGATIMFSEVTEVRDGVAQLTSRAATEDVAREIIREMDWYDRYLQRGRVDRSANTTPGNKKGGLSNIVEKAMGPIVKSGSAPIAGVVRPGDRAKQKGLLYAATPASDFICGTLQLAAGMNLHIFTTGRGTPYGLAQVPVIKVATRSDLARRWHDLMDLDAGQIATGAATIEDTGWALFRLMLDVASGKRRTWAEQWKLANALTLFNPAPVT